MQTMARFKYSLPRWALRQWPAEAEASVSM